MSLEQAHEGNKKFLMFLYLPTWKITFLKDRFLPSVGYQPQSFYMYEI